MARDINYSDLSDEDKFYIVQRPWLLEEARLQGVDVTEEVMEVVESRSDGAVFKDIQEVAYPHEKPADPPTPPAPADPPAPVSNPETPEIEVVESEIEEEESDNYDDETAWSHEDIKEEVKSRASEDKPALNKSRADLIAWLRQDDVDTAEETDDSEQE